MKEILKESIKMHYDNKDYTEVVRDAILCLMNEIRKKSDLQDDDGVNLINKAFSEKKPLIKINKMQTENEKNKQKGINDLSKGIVEYFRNPMSHSKQNYSKEIADALLVIIDKVLLEEIMESKSINSIDDWYLEITSDLSPNTERYAKNLVDSIPKLITLLYKNRGKLKEEKLIIVNELIKKINEDNFLEYCSMIESDLYGNSKEEDIIKILTFVSKRVWDNFSNLSKVKIEDMVLEDIKKCNIFLSDESYGYGLVQKYGNIAAGAKHLINFFSNKREIANYVYKKLVDSIDEDYQFDFIIDVFYEILIQETKPKYDIINSINQRLEYANEPIWYSRLKEKLKNTDTNNEWYISFKGTFFISNDEEELPF